MSWLITATVATGVVTAVSQVEAAKQEKFELEKQADEEKIAAEGRELERRQKLNKILSQNIVAQTGAGIAGEGTPESIALASAKQAGISEGLEGLSARLKRAQLKRQARTAGQVGGIQAASTLLKTATQAEQLG